MPGRDPRAIVRAYHEQTKHHFNRFARSLGYLDWATQPHPFRTFAGAETIDLVEPLRSARAFGRPADAGGSWVDAGFDDLFARPRAGRLAPGLPAVSVLLRYSLGLSAWKQAGPSRWALRVNPSSGNLHPTEGYVVLGPGVAGAAGVFHYAPQTHALERRCAIDAAGWEAAAVEWPPGAFLCALSAIHWREAWKYGERAFRYCQHDTGHAVAALRYAAALIGWDLRVVRGWTSAGLAALMGLDRAGDFTDAEAEEPSCLMLVSPSPAAARAHVDTRLADVLRGAPWTGRANQLSPDHVPWEWIDAVAAASRVVDVAGAADGTDAGARDTSPAAARRAAAPVIARPGPGAAAPSAETLLLQRRSAQRLDGTSSIDLDRFLAMMRRLLPDAGVPFDALATEPRVHLALFVHRVNGLEPGIYALVRSARGAPRPARVDAARFPLGEAGSRARRPAAVPARAHRLPRRRAAAQLRAGHRVRRVLQSRNAGRVRRGPRPRAARRATASSSGKPARSARPSTSKPRPPAPAARASAASSTTASTSCSASLTTASRACTTSPSACRSRTRA